MSGAATLPEALAQRATLHPERTALAFGERRTTYGELWRHAQQVAHALIAAGTRPGDRIAYIGRNTDRYFQALYGAMLAGAVMTPVNWRLAEPEIVAIVADAGARLAITASPIALPDTIRTVPLDNFDSWRDAAPPAPLPTPDPIAIQLYTSGTTGRPKGVMLSHANFLASFRGAAEHNIEWAAWRDDDASLLAMPVSHVSGSGWGMVTLHHGGTCHIHAQFDVEATLRAVAEHRIAKCFLVPAALQMLVRHPAARQTDFSCIREMGYGASPMPPSLLQECMDVLGCRFVQFYGMTETAGTIVALDPHEHHQGNPRLATAGRALPWVELRVVDDGGNDVAAGEIGEIVTRSPQTMAGYWNQPAATDATFRNGWLRTGDAARLDSDGYITILDRVKDMVITGGENVYPAEVEAVLAAHPAVAEVAVIGIPDAQWGEAVTAIVVPRPGAAPDEAALIAWTRERLAGFKTPKRVIFAATLPRNASGKVLKRELRRPFWEGAARQVN